MKEISTLELENWISNGEDFQIIDVRETSEYEQINIGAHLIPLGEVIARNHEIEREKGSYTVDLEPEVQKQSAN